MTIEDQEAYQRLEKVADDCRQFGANLMVVSLSGMGAGYLLESWAKKAGVDFETAIPEKRSGMVVVDRPENSWEEWEKMSREAPKDQKFVMVVSATRMNEENNSKNWVLSHVYKTVYLGVRSEADISQLIAELGVKVTSEELAQIYKLSGGIPKLAKWLAINGKGMRDVEQVALPILKEVRGVGEDDLEKLGVVKNGKYVSTILADLDKKTPKGLSIEVKFDLELIEDGRTSGVKVTTDEKKIIMEMLAGGGMVTREKIAEIKWGEGSYDKFSDQAINMAMRRLSRKFEVYEIETVPRVGYQIKRK